MKKISFIIPAYNSHGKLRKAVESCLSANNSETIVVNDASPEDEYSLICDLPIEYIELSKNVGHATALNKGISLSRGEYISWIGQDDYWYPESANKMVEFLDCNPDIGVVYSNFDYTRNGMHTVHVDEYSKEKLEGHNYIGQFVIYRKKLGKDIGIYNESFVVAQDWEYWLRMSKITNFSKVDVVGGLLYHNENGVSATNYDICTKEIKKMIRDMYPDRKFHLTGHKVIYET